MACPPKPTVAELHRAIAAAHLALAERLEAEDGGAVAPPPPVVQVARAPRLPIRLPPQAGKPDDIAAARARRGLKKLGYRAGSAADE